MSLKGKDLSLSPFTWTGIICLFKSPFYLNWEYKAFFTIYIITIIASNTQNENGIDECFNIEYATVPSK